MKNENEQPLMGEAFYTNFIKKADDVPFSELDSGDQFFYHCLAEEMVEICEVENAPAQL